MELNRRQTELLLYLLQDRKPKYGSELAEKFSVTDRTVRNDIQRINQELSNYDIYISASKKEGYYISGDCLSRIKEKRIIQEIAEQFDFDVPETQNERMVYLLFSMLFNNRYTQEDIEELFYLSPSVVYGDLKATEKWLKGRRMGLELKKKNGFYYLDEEESIVRSLISGIYTQRSNLVLELKYSYFISGNSEFWELIYQLIPFVCDFLKNENLMLTGKSIFSFCTDIALTYYRTSQGFIVTNELGLSCVGAKFRAMLITYDEKYRILNDSDYSYLMERLAGKDFLSNNPFITVSDKTKKLVTCFSEKVFNLGKSVVHPEYICNEIETIMYIKKQRYYYSINGRRNIFRNNLEALYLTVLFSYYLHMFYPEIELNRHDMARLTVCLRNSISSVRKRIMLVCDSSRYTVNRIKEKIERRFHEKALFEKVATQFDYQNHKQGIDGIVTTASIDETEIPCIEIDVNTVDDYMNDIDFFLDSLHYSNMDIYEEQTEEKELELVLKVLLKDLWERNLIASTDFEYVLNNILRSSILFVRNNRLVVMIPMISSEQIKQFRVLHKGIYNDAEYTVMSLFVFSDDISMISFLYKRFS